MDSLIQRLILTQTVCCLTPKDGGSYHQSVHATEHCSTEDHADHAVCATAGASAVRRSSATADGAVAQPAGDAVGSAPAPCADYAVCSATCACHATAGDAVRTATCACHATAYDAVRSATCTCPAKRATAGAYPVW